MAPTKRSEVIPIRVTPAEKQKIERAAKKAGLPVSSYLRHLALTNG